MAEYLKSNIVLMKNMIADGYADARTLQRRIEIEEAWLANRQPAGSRPDAEYAAVIEIDLADIKEPIVCCPNDPDDASSCPEVAGTKIDEAFIGSCMTNIGHFAPPASCWKARRTSRCVCKAPPTKMDAAELTKEGYHNTFSHYAGARTEMPGCRCTGNQVRSRRLDLAIYRPTRNRSGREQRCSCGCSRLVAVASKTRQLPTPSRATWLRPV